MLLLSAENLCQSFGVKNLFNNLSLAIFKGDRIGLIGKNGTGKSTLLKILASEQKPDSGKVTKRGGCKIGYLPQSCEFEAKLPFDILMESIGGHEKEHLVKKVLSKVGFTGNEPTANLLSGGWKKRLMLAKEMLKEPDILFLDEPTNHLDLDGVEWLEKFLATEELTYILVSHDRYFLNHATNRIIELDHCYPEGIFSIDSSYANFLEKKEIFLEGQKEKERSLASKAKREVEWLRAGVKARTTKSQSRKDAAYELLDSYAQVQDRNRHKHAKIEFISSSKETKKLLVAKNVMKKMGDRVLFQSLDMTLSPGIRVGLVGPNGSGKTTLMALFAGKIEPDMGTIKRADNLKIVYFDQHRTLFADDVILKDALSPQGDFVTFQGQKIHVNGWAERFCFSKEMLALPIGKLSGGERARIAIAHLMLEPADLLFLDEPTNDLDIPTLEILEKSLLSFTGAIVLISHDRCMLDHICNRVVVLGNSCRVDEFASYAQWENSKKPEPIVKESPKIAKESKKASLTYAEQKEYKQIEEKITKVEKEIEKQTHALEASDFATDPQGCSVLCQKIETLHKEMDHLYLRWEELEKR